MDDAVESAINDLGAVAVVVPPQPSGPGSVRISDGRILILSGDGTGGAYRMAREAALAAIDAGRILVVEAVGARVVRESVVSVSTGSA